MEKRTIKPEKVIQSIKGTAAKLNTLLHSAEMMNITVVIKPTNAFSTANEPISGTKSVMAIIYPIQ